MAKFPQFIDATFSIGGVDFSFERPPPPKPAGPTWDDVIGQSSAKKALREAVEGMTKHADIYRRYGRRSPKGVLLHGPPGNGKTMLAKAAATALGSSQGGFRYVRGPEVNHPYFGESERQIREMFAAARQHKARHGVPQVLFLDEAEALLSHRTSKSVLGSIVTTFLVEMDGLDDSGAFVVLATNRPESIDSAVLREGRIDRKILVGRPTRDDAHDLFSHALRGRPLDCAELGVDIDLRAELAACAVRDLYDPAHLLYVFRLADGTRKHVTLGDFTSGAQITALVDAAASFAIAREIETRRETGIRVEDVHSAIVQTLTEQRDLHHPADLAAFAEDFADRITGLERVRSDGTVIGRHSMIQRMPEGYNDVEVLGPLGRPRHGES